MHRVIFVAVLCLSACVAAQTSGVALFRQPEAPIYSAAAFDPSRLAGQWRQVATYSGPEAADCAAGQLDFMPVKGGADVTGQLCLDGRIARVSGAVASVGPGRFSVAGMSDWWVIWADSGYRTLAIGTPSGAFGFVLDRGQIPADRYRAAREIFDFNGYDAARMRPI